MSNKLQISRKLVLNREGIIKEIKKPGRVFVYTKLTCDDVFLVEAVKVDLISTLTNGNWYDDGVFFEAYRDEFGLYLGW